MNDPDTHSLWLSTATALFFTWALLTLAVRLWVKLRRRENWGLDDSTISAAFALALAHIALILSSVHDGYGDKPTDQTVAQRIKTEKILYVATVGLTKVSTSFFIARLTRYGPQVKVAYGLAAFSGLWTIAGLLVIALRGNLSAPWATLDGQSALFVRWAAVESAGLLMEFGTFALSINLIWGLHMSLQKRVLILAAFGCRLILVPIIVLRLLHLSPSRYASSANAEIVSGIITEAVMEYSLFSASITCLKPFLQPFHSGYIVNSIGAPGSGLRTRSQEPYYQLSGLRETDKNDVSVSSKELRRSVLRQHGDNGDKPLRGDFGQFSATATASSPTPADLGEEGIDIIRQSEGSRPSTDRPMVIMETKTFVVSETRVNESVSSSSSSSAR